MWTKKIHPEGWIRYEFEKKLVLWVTIHLP